MTTIPDQQSATVVLTDVERSREYDPAGIGMLESFDWYVEHVYSASTHTRKAKTADLKKFAEYLSKKIRNPSLQVWTVRSTQEYLDALLRDGEAPATVSRRLATLKHAARIICERLRKFNNPTLGVRGPKLQALRPKALDVIETQELAAISFAAPKNFKEARDRSLIGTLLMTGLRADEVRELSRNQLADDFSHFRQVRTKGRQYRDVPINSRLKDMLQLYLEFRATELKRFFPQLGLTVDKSLPLFIGTWRCRVEDKSSFRLGSKSIWRIVHSFSQDSKLHPHLLRHTFAHSLLEESGDVRLVAQALGHSDVRVTMRYTERATDEVARHVEAIHSKIPKR